jgi:hypothetical protein
MTIIWTNLPVAIREELEVLGIGPGSNVYIRKLNGTRITIIAQEYTALRADGLGPSAAIVLLAKRHQRDPRTIRRYLSAVGGAR